MGLIIFISYFFILSSTITLTEETVAPPWLTFWVTHLLLGGIGIYLLRQASLEKPNILITWVDQILLTLQKRARKNVDS
jgi:hypothetical protein